MKLEADTVVALQSPGNIDWSQPWLQPYQLALHVAADITAVSRTQSTLGHIAEWLNATGLAQMRFVPQSVLPPTQAYEQFIFNTGTVPTRDNLHDFFNGLCWLHFPLTKKRLNQLQAAEIARAGVQQLRGRVRDALTVFDENAAFLCAPQALWDALEARDWKKLFIELRPLWAEAQLVLFGHALLEKLVSPRKPITAHVYRAQPAIDLADVDVLKELDAWVASELNADKLATKPFLPLPVLGVPGWWPENENFCFYDDSHVFRPRR